VMNIVWSTNSAQSIRNLQHAHNTNSFPLGGGVCSCGIFGVFVIPNVVQPSSYSVHIEFSMGSQLPIDFPNICSIPHHFVTYALHSIVLLEPIWANSGTYMWSEYFNIRGFESFRTFFEPMKEADCKKILNLE